MAIASSIVEKRITGETGPKVSCFTTVIDGVTLSITVGEYRAPSRRLPARQLGALGDGLVHARFEELRRGLVDDGAHLHFRVGRIAEAPRLGLGHQQVDEALVHLLVHEDALHRGAALAAVAIGALHGERGGLVEVRVLHDDERVVAAQLEHHAAIADLGGDGLAHRHAAGERDEVDLRVRDELVGDLARVAGDDLQHLLRQARLVQQLREEDRRERRLLGGLQDHPVVGRHRRRHLVRHLVHRVVERRDRGDDAGERLAARVDAAVAAVRRDVAGEGLAVVAQRLGGAEVEHVGDAARPRTSSPSSRGPIRG
jgi:hypothetical protein